jgi:hypothetical protein
LSLLAPVTRSSLAFSPAELGRLGPGETRAMACPIRNQSRRVLRLSPPKVSCGCVSLSNGLSVLRPGESKVLQFSYHAPGIPRKVEETIRLEATDFPDLSWVIPVRGQVSADVWAEPNVVELITDGPEAPEAIVRIHHDERTFLGEIRADSPVILAEPISDAYGLERVKVSLTSKARNLQEFGEAVVHVMEFKRDDKEILSIPVKWRPMPTILWVPKEFSLEDYDHNTRELQRPIVVRGIAKEEAQTLRAEPLVPWVRVEGRDVIGEVIRLTLVFDPSAMPDRIDHQRILRLCPEHGPCETVSAHGRRR